MPEGRFGEDVAEFSPLLLPPPVCRGEGLFTNLRIGLPIKPLAEGGVAISFAKDFDSLLQRVNCNKVYKIHG